MAPLARAGRGCRGFTGPGPSASLDETGRSAREYRHSSLRDTERPLRGRYSHANHEVRPSISGLDDAAAILVGDHVEAAAEGTDSAPGNRGGPLVGGE